MYIKNYLEAHGKVCHIAENVLNSDDDKRIGRKYISTIPEDAECVIVLGGDGTMLQAARSAAYIDIPLIGVNLGTLGYLAEVEKSGVDDALDQIIAGKYEIEDRMMLYGSVTDKNDYALNDIVITKSSAIQAINFDIYVNDLFLSNYHADGIIISTPTGSTGYSMSAGGPLVEPSADMILITPICPHTMNSRSMVLSSQTKIEIRIGEGRDNRNQQVVAYFDGSGTIEMQTGDRINIEKANKTTKILKLNKISFLEALGRKFDK
jgi:NAD+ kinase